MTEPRFGTGFWYWPCEDLVSIVFREAWQRRDIPLPEGKVRPWVFGIATNVGRNALAALFRRAPGVPNISRNTLQLNLSKHRSREAPSKRRPQRSERRAAWAAK